MKNYGKKSELDLFIQNELSKEASLKIKGGNADTSVHEDIHNPCEVSR